MSKITLELITDVDIYNLIDTSIRGGVSMIFTRHAKANNPSLTSYDPALPRCDLIYLDANNLYGHAMSQYFPTGGFRVLSDEETQSLELENLSDDGDEGNIYEVYLHYPIELHDKHDDYPLAPQSIEIDSTMYSPTQSSVYPKSPPQKKLTPNLMDKSNYVVHYRNLKLYVQLGLVITKVHRVLAFKQSPWLKRYIDFNTHQRSLSNSGFLKDFFTLMNNSVFGKTQENLWNRVNVEIITDAALIRKQVAKPSFCRGMHISNNLAIIQCKIQTITLNRPIFVGFTVLELSKLHMYDFHYNHMKTKYPRANEIKLLFTDTDSLAYAIQTNSIYEDMAVDASEEYDFSEYPKDHPLYSTSNKKALGYFKDELNSVPMKEFVGLRPKCYAFRCTGKIEINILQHSKPVEKKTAKCTKRKGKDKHLHFHHYLDVFKNFHSFVNLISSTYHTVRSVHQKMIGLTAFDTKRWLCEDTIHTHSHGHHYARMVNSNNAFIGKMVDEAIKRLKPDY